MDLIPSILQGKDTYTSNEIWELTGLIQDLYRTTSNIVELKTDKVIFVGDLHGELSCARAVQHYIKDYPNHHFIFLGDYADRGPQQIETFNLIITLTLAYPERVIMLRGNHESDRIATKYGFYNVVTRLFSFDVFKHYSRVFEALPIGVYNKSNFIAFHGGVPEGVSSIEDIQSRNRRHPDFPDDVICQIVWNDPKEGDFRFRNSTRGERTRFFGKRAFTEFMENVDAQVMFRAHEVFPEGYKTFFDDKLVSVFSATYGTRVQPKIIRLTNDLAIEPLVLNNQSKRE